MTVRIVAGVEELPQGKTLVVQGESEEVLLCHTVEGVFAVSNLCSHAAARLCEGKLKGHKILCPLHGAAFDVRDGSALTRPASIPLKTYEVEISGSDILLSDDPG